MMIYSHHLSADCLMDTCSSERVSTLLPFGLLPVPLITDPSLSLEPTVIAKSSLLLDVKPWDDETDMAKLEECVRSIQMDGLVWGQCKYCGNKWMQCSSDDLTHHLSAELEMTLINLKCLHSLKLISTSTSQPQPSFATDHLYSVRS